MVKIRLKQKEEEKEIVVDALLDSGATGLVMSDKFMRKHRFKRLKLEKLIYIRNVNGTLNYVGPIVDTMEVEIFFKGHCYNQCLLYTAWTRVKGNDDMISCTATVSVSTSCNRCYILASTSCIMLDCIIYSKHFPYRLSLYIEQILQCIFMLYQLYLLLSLSQAFA